MLLFFAGIPAPLGRRDVEDAVPYDYLKCSIEFVGAGLLDGPPMPDGIRKRQSIVLGKYL